MSEEQLEYAVEREREEEYMVSRATLNELYLLATNIAQPKVNYDPDQLTMANRLIVANQINAVEMQGRIQAINGGKS